MESVETSITQSEPRQPTLRDRLLFSSWYLEARITVEQFTAHHSEILRKLNRFVGGVR
jgi:hypothetical protein